jgi:hypothetical protein
VIAPGRVAVDKQPRHAMRAAHGDRREGLSASRGHGAISPRLPYTLR